MGKDTRFFVKMRLELWERVLDSGIDYNTIIVQALTNKFADVKPTNCQAYDSEKTQQMLVNTINFFASSSLSKLRYDLVGKMVAIKAFSKNIIDESTALDLQKMQDESVKIDAELGN